MAQVAKGQTDLQQALDTARERGDTAEVARLEKQRAASRDKHIARTARRDRGLQRQADARAEYKQELLDAGHSPIEALRMANERYPQRR